MNFSLDKSKCSYFLKHYKYVLTKYLGIGNCLLNYTDLLYSYTLLNSSFLPAETQPITNVTTKFIGIVTSDGTLLPGETTVVKFYINDQAAFDDGVEVGQIYYLSLDNTYGMPYGMPKKLVEDVE
jgi:hypothetical protein